MLKVVINKRRDPFTLAAEFQAPTPGIVALFGRSGCGKSTTIDIVSGLLRPDEGRVEVDGVVLEDTGAGIRIAPERRNIGYVFQNPRLFPHLGVERNLRYGQKRARAVNQTILFEQVVSLLGLERLLERRPHELSGGERQRVSLGRALLSQPRLLLLDEPFASLDLARREEVLPYLEVLRDNFAIPMVYVSHQFDEVLRLATHVVLMDSGKVLAQGSLNEVSLLPALRSIVGPDSVGAVLDGTVLRTDPAQGLADLRVGGGTLRVGVRNVTVGEQVRVQLLARDIILATEAPRGLSVRNALAGRIVEVMPDGQDSILIKVDVGGPVVLARVTQDAVAALDLALNRAIWVLVKAVSTRGHAFKLAAA